MFVPSLNKYSVRQCPTFFKKKSNQVLTSFKAFPFPSLSFVFLNISQHLESLHASNPESTIAFMQDTCLQHAGDRRRQETCQSQCRA